ncbi:amino acid adenylation domain-containing protein [Gordonia iterans]
MSEAGTSRDRIGASGGAVEAGTLIDILAHRDIDEYHPALICDGAEVAYGEFEARTNRIARALLARGVRPDDVVAVGMERSIDSVIAVWGIVKSGAAYLSIDPAYPEERIAYMLDDSAVRFGITAPETRDRFGSSRCAWTTLDDIEAEAASGDPISDAERTGVVRRENLAYLIYTSGSTGRPKGVAVSHTGIADLVANYGRVTGSLEDDPDTRILHVASPSFDASFFEMAWAITAGHTLVVAPHADYAGAALGSVLERHEVTDMVITPSVLATLDPAHGESVRNLATAGEACPPELVERWAARGRRLFNFYGPSETTVWATRARMMPRKPITIGRAVSGFTARVLDPRLHEVPDGVVGELYLSAVGLARGYLGRADLTATSFVADPFGAPGDRMYATGDLVRLVKGELEFAGRADHQVKINGQRVELGEIESVLEELSGVAQAVVVGHDVEQGGRKHTQLVAYLVARPGESVDVDAVAAAAADRLAAHMVPSQLFAIDEIPLTPAGKLDRTALPNPEAGAARAAYVAPETDGERTLAAIIGGLLVVEQLGVTESFFALGGDSIMSIQVSSAAKAAGLPVSPRDIFQYKTVREIVRAVDSAADAVPTLEEPSGGGVGELVLPPIVEWMIDSAAEPAGFADFNQSSLLSVPPGLDTAQLREVLAAVVAAHPMLAARLSRTNDRWTLAAGESFDAGRALTERDVADTSDSPAYDAEILDSHARARGRLAPAAARVVEAELVRFRDGARRLVLVVHHLAVDAVSWPILIEDLATAAAQIAAGEPVALRAEATSERAWFAALAARREDHAGELDYWLRQSPEQPTRFSVEPVRNTLIGESTSLAHHIPARLTERLLTDVPSAFGGTLTDVLLGALARAVRSWQHDTGIDDTAPITVMNEGHGRYEDVLEAGRDPRRSDLSRTVGWFTTIAPILIDPAGDIVHAVKAAKEARLAQPHHGIGFGLLRYGSDTELSRRPLPSVAFNYLGGRGASADESAATGDLLLPAAGPALPGGAGGMIETGVLAINASTVAGDDGPTIVAGIRFPEAVIPTDHVRDIAARWTAEIDAAVGAADRGRIGLSPSDVPGAGLTQDDLDQFAEDYPRADVWPLTPLQHGLFFQAELTGDTALDVYVTQAVLSLGGDLDLERLYRSVEGLFVHHRSLRAGFVRAASGAVAAVVPRRVEPRWRTVVIDEGDGDAVRAAVDRIALEEKVLPFDLARPPLMRIVVVTHPGGADVVVTNHHILLDGWSGPLVLADLLALYATGATYTSQLGSGDLDFADYVRWIGRADHAAGIAAWREVLAPVAEPTLVATSISPSADPVPRDQSFPLGDELTRGVEQLARERGITVPTVLQFAWAVLLSRLTGNQVVSFAETVSGRPADLNGVESMVGLFINTLPAVVDVDPRKTIGEVLEATQDRKVQVLEHQHLGLPELTALTGLRVLFDTHTVYESYPVDQDSLTSTGLPAGDGDTLQILDARVGDATHYPLSLAAAPTSDGIVLLLKYLPGAFSDEQIGVFGSVLRNILTTVLSDPGVCVGDVALLAEADVVAESAWEWGVARSLPAVVSVGDAVAARVAVEPGAVALVCGERVVSYGEFGARVNRLARVLIAAGVGPECAVAVAVPRSVEMMVAVHAVVAAGGQYVPIDLGTPVDRVEYMLATSRAGLLLVSERGVVREALAAAEAAGVSVLEVDASGVIDVSAAECAPIAEGERLGSLSADSAVYTLFTSGSTGMPKGVTLSHGAVLNRFWWGLNELPIGESDVVVQKTPYTFDCSVPELFAPLLVGASVVVLKDGGHLEPVYVASEIARTGATMVHFVPSMLSVFLDVVPRAQLEALTSVRIVSATGEALPPAVAAPARELWPDALFYNLYGPTEAAIEITYQRIEQVSAEDSVVPIGVPVWNSSAVVLDGRLHRVPVGVPGELYLGGVQLARGYAARADLTAERFVADPFGGPGARLYRTGDLVRRRSDGALEYVGRTDFQVKLRGQRIELGEVEAVLAGAPGVVHAAASVVRAPDGGEHLVGYVCAGPGESVDLDGVKGVAAAALPGYMVPSVWMAVEAIGLNTAGKIDRKSLPVPQFGGVAAEYVAPEGEVEEALAGVFAGVLGVDRVGVTESFFQAGGNSLSAMRLVARAGEVLGVELSVRDLFEAPSVRELVSASAGKSSALPPVTAVVPRPERIPLSFAQQRMWFINRLDPTSPVYNMPAVLRVRGRLDVAALHAALIDVVERHEVLRTTFPDIDGVPYQLIADRGEIASGLDWSLAGSEAEVESAVLRGFDLAQQWPIRVRVLAESTDVHVLAVVTHHIATDGESQYPLLTDLMTAYAARVDGLIPQFAPLDVQFADFAIWQHRVLGAPDDPDSVVARQLAYWSEKLSGIPDVLELPADRPRPKVAGHVGRVVHFEVSEEVGTRIQEFAEHCGATPFMVLHAAFSALLARLSAMSDISIITPVAGRGQASLDRLVGMFVNTLVLRTTVNPEMDFTELVKQAKETDLEALAHADVPFEAVVDALDPVRSEAFAPLAQVLLSYDPAASVSEVDVSVAGLRFESVVSEHVPAQLDLYVTVSSAPEGPWGGSIVYATELFEHSTAQRFAAQFVHLLDGLLSDPGVCVGDVALLAEADVVAESAWEWGVARSLPAVVSVGDAVAARVAVEPGAVALVCGERVVSYGEFGARVNRLARVLIAAGVGPECAVAVAVPRSVEMMVAVHAVVAAGGQYVPIDLGTPVDRVEYMLATSRAGLLLVSERGVVREALAAAEAAGVSVLEVDASGVIDVSAAECAPIAEGERLGSLSADSAVYTLFTSGSTGMPKGVTLSHGAVLNRFWWGLNELPIGESDVVVQKTPYTFDCSVPELFAPLLVGASVVVLKDGGHLEPVYVASEIARTGATMVHFVPSMLSVFLDVVPRAQLEALTSVRIVSATGEALPPAVAAPARELWPDALFYNLYGPTEAAIEITYQRIEQVSAEDSVVPIGVPVWNSSAVVLDGRLHRVPVGVPGELYLGGVQLARGYAARADLTAERFVADPFGGPGARLYRTGDLVRRRSDGALEYVGRTDFQVKLRGQRIELGEVEAVLAGAPGVVHAAASVVRAPDGGEHLVGYVCAGPGESVDLDGVKGVAAAALPGYMVPSVWMAVEAIGLNTAGKIDRKSLPVPQFGGVAAEYVAPEGEVEEALAGVFAGVLGVDRVGVTESFFQAGGNSLSAMRLVARAGEVLGVELSVRDLFEAPSVRELVSASAGKSSALPPVTAVVPRPERIPLSFAQQRMWFINRLDPTSPVYNMPAVLRVRGRLDVAALHAALIDVVERHEVLRTTFPDIDGVPYQLIADRGEIASGLDWSLAGSEAEVESAVLRGFDLAQQWPIRVRVLAESTDVHVLAVVTHHIATDGESQYPLLTDLMTAYAARVDGLIPQFAPLDVQFADFAIWQHRVLGAPDDPDSVVARQLAYWSEKLSGIPDVLELPADRPRPKVAGHVGRVVHFEVSEEVGTRIQEFAEHCGATPFMVLHAAFSALLARLSAMSDISIITPVAGRGQASLDRLVGMFVNTLVLRTTVNPEMDFTELVKQAKETDLEALAHADVPFEAVVDALDPVRSEAFAPLAQVLLSYDPAASVSEVDVSVAGLRFESVVSEHVPAQLDLYVTVSSAPEGPWGGSIVYATELFEHSTAQRFAAQFVHLLDGLLSDPGVCVGDVALLAEADVVAESAWEWGVARSLPAVVSVGDAVAARVAVEPGAVALVCGERVVSYGEFGARVNRLARVLIAAGVGPECAVAVAVPRSVEMMVAVHAVVAAGGQYVPIDLGTPVDRVEYMLATSRAGLLLVSERGVVREALAAAEAAGVSVLEVDASGVIDVSAAECAPIAEGERLGSLSADSAVYTLFTSGSTGMPKGVTLSHGAVLNRFWWGLNELPIGESDVVVQKTPYTFDCSVPELFAPLLVGASVVVLKDGGHLEPVYVASEIARTGATMVHFVPSMLSVFLDVVPRAQLEALTSVRIVSATGEALPPAVAAPARELWPDALFYNLYGPTEAAIEITYQRIEQVSAEDSVVPIGVPVWNSSAVVLDGRLHRVPVGVPGELYLGGVQLARGYAARADLTAERFVADPFGGPGARLYRTGDLVRRRSDGALEYVGRTDFQVKLRGQRIELGEVEAVLAGAPGVVHAAASVVRAPDGGEHLVGYVCAGPGESVDLDGVKGVAAAALPGYMVPSVWMAVEAIGLNTAGKIDRKSLPVPQFGGVAAEYVAPEGEVEEALAGVFAGVLGVDRVGVTESFFQAGGNSLSAMRLVARAGEVLGVELSVRDLFEAPSVRELVAVSAGKSSALPPVTAVVPRPERIPLSFAQQRMWFINRFDPSQSTYNIPVVLRLAGDLDVAALRAAVGDVVERHEVLRTTFPAVDGVPFELIAPAGEVSELLDRVWRVVDSQAEVESAVTAGFDVTAELPVRVRLWPVSEGEFVLGVVTHHIAADGESLLPLVTDLVSAYAARAVGEVPGWVPLEVQFADFAIWQHEVLGSPSDPDSVLGRQLAFWAERLVGVPDVLELPGDRPRPAVASHAGVQVDVEVPARVAERVEALARARGVTPFMVAHAVFAVLLSRLSDTDDIVVGTPIAGRGQAVLDQMIGQFANTLVLRTVVDQSESFGELLSRVRAADVDAFAHSEIPFETLVEAVDPVRTEAFSPLVQVIFSFDPGASAAEADVEVAGLSVVPVEGFGRPAQLDLDLTLSTNGPGGSWLGVLVGAADMFDTGTLEVFGSRFVALLDALTADPGLAVGDAPWMTEAEVRRAVRAAAGPVRVWPVQTLADGFARQAAERPGAEALVFGGRSVSYGELGARVYSLARELIALGVGPDVPVGVCLDRGVEMLVAIQAVLAAGGQYVPVDVDVPAERAEYMVATAGVELVLVAAGEVPEPVAALGDRVRVHGVDGSAEVDLAVPPVLDGERRGRLGPANAAYTLFTSGSTGRPKGVTISHGAVGNFLQWFNGLNVGEPGQRLLFKTPYTFDASVLELFWPLLFGQTMVIAEPGGHS